MSKLTKGEIQELNNFYGSDVGTSVYTFDVLVKWINAKKGEWYQQGVKDGKKEIEELQKQIDWLNEYNKTQRP